MTKPEQARPPATQTFAEIMQNQPQSISVEALQSQAEATAGFSAKKIGVVGVVAALGTTPALANAAETSASLVGPTEVTMTATSKNTVSKNFDIQHVLSGKTTVVADTPIPKNNKPGHETKACRWYGQAYNYYYLANGKKVKFLDKNVYACKDKDSPTGYVKKGGGRTGRDCNNEITPIVRKKPIARVLRVPLIKGSVTEVKSFKTSFVLHTEATVRVNCVSNAGSSEAYARGVGDQRVTIGDVEKQRVEYRALMGDVNARVSSVGLLRLRDQMATSAEAKVTCVDKPAPTPPTVIYTPPTPPPETPPTPPKNAPPTIDMVKPQHMLVGGILQVCGYVGDPDGLSDIKGVPTIVFSGGVNAVSDVYAGDESGEYCKDAKAGTTPGTAVATGTVTDSVGNQATDTIDWPIVSDQLGNPGGF